jgi:hypothetical protein
LGGVHQANAHSILNPDSRSLQGVSKLVHHRLDLGVCKGLVRELDGDVVSPTFPNMAVKEIVGYIQLHGGVCKLLGYQILRPCVLGR